MPKLKWWEWLIVLGLAAGLLLHGIRIAHAGAGLTTISDVMTIIQIKNDREMQRIYKQIEEARRLSQHGLSPDEIRKIKEQADGVLDNAKKSSSSPLTPNEQRLEKIKQRSTDKNYVETELNRWISELIFQSVNEHVDNNDVIQQLFKIKKDYMAGKSIGASVQTSSIIVEVKDAE